MTQEEVTGTYVTDRVRVAGAPLSDGLGDVDNFEDANLDEYVATDDVKGAWTFVDPNTDPGTDISSGGGTNAIKTSTNTARIQSTNGLTRYPARGDKFRVYYYFASSANVGSFQFAVSDTRNFYELDPHPNNSSFSLRIQHRGNTTTLDEVAGLTIPADTWLRMEVDWKLDGEITADLYNDSTDALIATVNAVDDTFKRGGIAYQYFDAGNTAEAMYVNDVEITDTRIEQGGLQTGQSNPVSAMLANSLRERMPLADDGELYDSVGEAVANSRSFTFVPPGTFNESVYIQQDGFTLMGAGRASYIRADSANAIDSPASNVTVTNLSASSSSGGGISLGDYATVANCWIRDATGTGIAPGLYSVVYSNIIEKTSGGTGIGTGGRSLIIGNHLKDVDGTAAIREGNHDSVVAYNVIKPTVAGSSTDGIYIGNDGADDTIVLGNTVRGADRNGITIFNPTDVIVGNNRVADSSTNISDSGTTTLLDANLTAPSNPT